MTASRFRIDLLVICLIAVLFTFGSTAFTFFDPWTVDTELDHPKPGIGDFIAPIIVLILSFFVIREKNWAKWFLGIWLLLVGLFAVVAFGYLSNRFRIVFTDSLFPFRMHFIIRLVAGLVAGLYLLFAGIYILVTVKKGKRKKPASVSNVRIDI